MYKRLPHSLIFILCLFLSTASVKSQCVGEFTVTTTLGDTVVDICSGNTSTVVRVVANIRGFPILYVLTDANDAVLNVTTYPVFVFGPGGGNFRIYAATFKGRILQPVGENVHTATLTTLCAELSDNYVSIVSGGADMSTVQINDGRVDTTFCSSDGLDDWLIFDHSATSNNYTFLVTDDQGTILSVSDDSVNFEGNGDGECLVYGLDYEGNLLATPGQSINDQLADGCYLLSDNSVTVTKVSPAVGIIATTEGDTSLSICVGDTNADEYGFAAPHDPSVPFTFVITDDSLRVLRFLDVDSIVDFNSADSGTCYVFGLAYSGTLLLDVGDHILTDPVATSCFDWSDNSVKVVRSSPYEGALATILGDTLVYTCPGDGVSDIVIVMLPSGISPYIFIITDEAGRVISLSHDPDIDFEGAGEGDCYIWRSSYTGNLVIGPDDVLFADPVSDGCYAISDNAVKVVRRSVDAGRIATTQGDTSLSICIGDGMADEYSFASPHNPNTPFTFVITDDSLRVLRFLGVDSIVDFNTADSGTCYVFGLSYNGVLLLDVGDHILEDTVATSCYDWSDNAVQVVRSSPTEGHLATILGDTLVNVCVGDSMADIVILMLPSGNSPYIYIITDTANRVLALSSEPDIDFEGAGEGVCLVWRSSYTGNLIIGPDDVLFDDPVSDGCYLISDNAVEVVRTATGVGRIATTEGDTSLSVCIGDSVADEYMFAGPHLLGAPFTFVITDDSLRVLMFLDPDSTIDFNGADTGMCYVFGLSYTGDLLLEVGDHILEDTVATSCYDWSDNAIPVIRSSPSEGPLATILGDTTVYTCPGDSVSDIVIVELPSGISPYVYVITDVDGRVLRLSGDPDIDFEGAGEGDCYIWRVSYTGNVIIGPDDNLFDDPVTDGCYAISDNAVKVIRRTPMAGLVATIDGDTTLSVCVGDSVSDIYEFASPHNLNTNFTFVITDDSLNVLRFLAVDSTVDFEGADTGMCYVFGLSYNGDLLLEAGDHILEDTVATSCYDWSDNAVSVLRSSPTEGPLATILGDTTVYTCPGDSVSDIVIVMLPSGTSPYIYIITDVDGRVLSMTDDPSIDFDGAGEGDCYIWRSSYAGNLVIGPDDILFDDPVSDGCYVISDNPVKVIRRTPAAGPITTMMGDTSINVCVGDTMSDVFSFVGPYNTDVSFTYVITDDSGEVLDFFEADSTVDFNGAGSGICRVYGLSYHGDLLLNVGDQIDTGAIASACYDWSDNYVEVVRTNIDPGTLTTQYGNFAFTCPGDGIADELILTRQNDADTSIVIIVSDMGVVQMITNADTVDVEGLGEGSSIMVNLSFSGDILFEVGDTIMSDDDVATGCFALSDFVFIQRSVPYSDDLATVDGDTTAEFCTSDGFDDIMILDYAPSSAFPISYVVTDTSGMILATPSGDTLNFEGTEAGTCYVYAVAYTGFFTGQVGENIGSSDLSDDCYAISNNYVVVVRNQPDGGDVTLPDGSAMIYTCPGDTTADVLHFVRTGGSADSFRYIVTSEMNVVLSLPMADSMDFNGAEIGTCRVWGVAYTGNFIAQVGDTVTRNPISDDCYGLSSSFITVVRDTAEGGFITTVEGDTLVNVNTSDTISDAVTVMVTGASSSNSVYVVTGADDIILVVLAGNSVDFGMVPPGEYRIYHASYTGSLMLISGLNILLDAVSDDCYDVSSNFVRIVVTDNLTDGENDRNLSFDHLADQGKQTKLKVYPNPAADRIYLANIKSANEAVLVNTMGQVVQQRDLEKGEEFSFDLNGVPAGLYILMTMEDGRIIDQQQVMVQ